MTADFGSLVVILGDGSDSFDVGDVGVPREAAPIPGTGLEPPRRPTGRTPPYRVRLVPACRPSLSVSSSPLHRRSAGRSPQRQMLLRVQQRRRHRLSIPSVAQRPGPAHPRRQLLAPHRDRWSAPPAAAPTHPLHVLRLRAGHHVQSCSRAGRGRIHHPHTQRVIAFMRRHLRGRQLPTTQRHRHVAVCPHHPTHTVAPQPTGRVHLFDLCSIPRAYRVGPRVGPEMLIA